MDQAVFFVYFPDVKDKNINFFLRAFDPNLPTPVVHVANCCALHFWTHKNLSEPWWRLYLHDREGACLQLPGQDPVHMDPQAMYLIPPDTAYRTFLQPGRTGPVLRQAYVHFSLPLGWSTPSGHLYSGRVETNFRNRFFSSCTEEPKEQASAADLQLLISLGIQSLPPEIWNKGFNDKRILQAINLMQEKYAKQLDNSCMAKETGMSEGAFIRLFHEQTGISPIKFLNRLRLEKASGELMYSNKSIESIAQSCGFASRSYLTRVFMKKYGMGPAAYRRQRTVQEDWYLETGKHFG